MKHIITLQIILFILITAISVGQIPHRISYQGVLTTTGGAPVTDGSYDIQFSLFDVSSGGTALYAETHTGISVQRGAFTAIIGSFTSLDLPFDDTYYLEMTVNAGPGISTPITFPRSEFTSSPYSMRSETAVSATPSGTAGGDLTGSYPNPTLATGSVTLSKISTSGASNGQSLMYNGSNVVWGNPASGGSGNFYLPYVDSTIADTAAFMITNKGRGFVGVFATTDTGSYSLLFSAQLLAMVMLFMDKQVKVEPPLLVSIQELQVALPHSALIIPSIQTMRLISLQLVLVMVLM